MKRLFLITLGVFTLFAFGCSNSGNKKGNNDSDSNSTKVAQAAGTVYVAQLHALNKKVTGSETTGKAKFVVANDTMTVTIDVKGAPAGIEHWQHFHGFENGNDATCATSEQDANADGIIDVVETESVSGTTMVPFNDLPVAMEVGSDTYPVADEEGAYHYETKIPMDKLQEAFGKAFGGTKIDLNKRVLYIHGVPKDTDLPESVASIGDIPAQITLPIACGKIEKE